MEGIMLEELLVPLKCFLMKTRHDQSGALVNQASGRLSHCET